MRDPIQDIKKRTAAYWYIDGLAEIGTGCMILLIGLFNLVLEYWIPQPARALTLAFGQPLLIIAGFVGVRKIVITLKERLTFVRTGYVAYPRLKGKRRWIRYIASLIATAAAIAVVILLIPYLGENWLMAGTGFFTALMLLMIAVRVGLPRIYVLAIIVFAAGLATSLWRLPDPINIIFFLGVFGGAWALMGAYVLVRYLRTTRPSSEQEGES